MSLKDFMTKRTIIIIIIIIENMFRSLFLKLVFIA